jgi:hypothetical protein
VQQEALGAAETAPSGSNSERAVGELFTYALLLWPAVVALFELGSEGWQLWLRVAAAVWLLLMHMTAYRSKSGGRYLANSLAMLSACVAGFWWTHPGPWMYLWLVTIHVGLYASVRRFLR